jgi:pyruvate ferredoxin oxidoreductase alpha subunit
MVCMDGFILTHAYEQVEVPDQEAVDAFLPPFLPRQVLDPDDPYSIGAMVGPEAFAEVRYLAHAKHLQALHEIPVMAQEFGAAFGRASGGLIRTYRMDGARTAVVALGSVLGTIKDAVDDLRAQGEPIGVVGVTTFRPFPSSEIRLALRDVDRVVIIDKALAVGSGGIVGGDVRTALAGGGATTYDVVAGLGGRPITKDSLTRLFIEAAKDALPQLSFLDIDVDLVSRELARDRGA